MSGNKEITWSTKQHVPKMHFVFASSLESLKSKSVRFSYDTPLNKADYNKLRECLVGFDETAVYFEDFRFEYISFLQFFNPLLACLETRR